MFSAKEIRGMVKTAYFSTIENKSQDYYKDLYKLLKRVDLEMKYVSNLHKTESEVGQLVEPLHGPTELLEFISCSDNRKPSSYII